MMVATDNSDRCNRTESTGGERRERRKKIEKTQIRTTTYTNNINTITNPVDIVVFFFHLPFAALMLLLLLLFTINSGFLCVHAIAILKPTALNKTIIRIHFTTCHSFSFHSFAPSLLPFFEFNSYFCVHCRLSMFFCASITFSSNITGGGKI